MDPELLEVRRLQRERYQENQQQSSASVNEPSSNPKRQSTEQSNSDPQAAARMAFHQNQSGKKTLRIPCVSHLSGKIAATCCIQPGN